MAMHIIHHTANFLLPKTTKLLLKPNAEFII